MLLAVAALLAVVGIVAIVAAVVLQQRPPAEQDAGVLPAPPPPVTTTSTTPAGPPASPPARIVVGKIGVDSRVESVGLNPDRTMEVPAKGPLFDLAAWYRYSVTPGQQGPSVIIGHIDSAENGPSVFFRLGALAPGDTIDVTRADGRVVTFTVYATRAFPKDAFPTDDVYAGTPGPELRLITCSGSFDAASRNYRDNTVVFARESSPPLR
ncbi:class F sortase [Actinomycetospora termitidis]|uniref:Class F sortase n=1 Tax=Actinomycetospora termitidis TaxID=3053470 RepID=A0ABT7MCB6_9PSEU|nr:class F sortase [Actinomycetospora sp. Odt1-22]MDL5158283.1 class F sortase [Actinomycetospora sp. Odt1-22]